jgi:ABC-type phosphate transport system substrate-binding protein
MQYRVTDDTLAKQMAGELVLVNVATNRIFVANGTGARIWQAIAEGADLAEATARIADSAPDPAAAREEIQGFVAELRREGFVAER